MRARRLTLLFVLAAIAVSAMPADAQIAREDYLRFVPLTYPSLVRQTTASEQFTLFGDRQDEAYRDVQPTDGIDDRRGEWLNRLALRFAPIMVRNTPLRPVDFRAFYARPDFAINIDTWDLARSKASFVDHAAIPLGDLAARPCTAGEGAANADCRLLDLLRSYGPGRGTVEPEATAGAEQARFTVMYFDFPGFDDQTWKAEYWPPATTLGGIERTFVHPFVAEVPEASGGPGYELVLQYWFFYPENDGPNNHEGDWEHINVVVSPRSLVEQPLDADEMARLIAGRLALEGDDPLVMRRIEYYLHHYMFPMDFASPNVYQARADWDRQVRSVSKEERGGRWIWDRIRERAWEDEAETRINTHPVVWIGGDAIGIQSVLEKPGLRDRDGHASYPFRGYYKQIGPGVGERVVSEFDHRQFFADPTSRPEHVEDYADARRIALVPDWERVSDLVLVDPAVRREWAWMVLPLHFGFPASPSPAAGTIAHADMGNVAVVGPSFNGGWNRTGDSSGYDTYDAVKLNWATPMGAVDSFFPRLGWFNAPILYFMLKPPLDLAWRSIALPARAVAGSRLPTFVPASAPARRTVSFEVGAMATPVSKDFEALFVNRDQFLELAVFIAVALPPGATNLKATNQFPTVVAPVYSLVFHVSPRFSTESALVSYSTTLGFDVTGDGVTKPVQVRTGFNQFDYHGNTRFNLLTGRWQPYVKYGGGITWYQLKGMSVDGVMLPTPNSPVFRPKGAWYTLFFNETILGGGLDVTGFKLKKAQINVKGSYTAIYHKLGFERDAGVEFSTDLAKELAGKINSVWRHEFRVFASVSF